ncbi:hypothetical protein BGW36DRAFT_146688 [Talaromyces proteolyticus]|uniref:Uncharacterized protein n=1 Tax=Talaromyces proteolyticus TaxID=1131652 RepID=A0AAD4KU59_9EURO|nr:uncharacterized protein BGW36DRAFT_146688 [Talaromyces proteolyticus]KAH8698484.1 hypothetical protein BGW36DRAFT_146688 [Talaromyces proteolyticus]
MSDSSISPQHSGVEDAAKDVEATEAEDVPTPNSAVGPPTSACDILRPLSQVASQGLFPLPTSGSLASLARQQPRQIASTGTSTVHEEPLQSDSGTNATADSFDSESIRKFTAAAWRQQSLPGQIMPIVQVSSSRISPSNSEEAPTSHFSPSPYASIFPEGTESSPLFIHQCEEYEPTNEDSIRKYSESLQLFRRNNEGDDAKIWKRRVLEYR